jgi:hypothetical protein
VKAVNADGTPDDIPKLVLKTGREQQLTNLGREFAIGDFDVSADGREIIFDRAREQSDIVIRSAQSITRSSPPSRVSPTTRIASHDEA